MKRFIILSLMVCMVTGIAAQYATVKYPEPYRYEKRDGKLKILVQVPVRTGTGASVRVTLDGSAVEVSGITPEQLEIWLPLVGEKQQLQVFVGKQKTPVVSQLFSPLIPKDWGYFQQGMVHIISSSHQDIAWMNTPDSCRVDRIYNIINPALKMMEADPDFAFGMEQTLNLMEFLEEFPNRKPEVMRLYKEGRFTWGATYNQPYEGLESGEQLVRQAYYGRKWIKENLPGCDDVTAYNIDVPGRTLQMPQILAKSGIKNLFVSRMREGLYDWYSPDGSKIFTYTPGNYGWGMLVWKFFDKDAVTAFHELHHRTVIWGDYYKKHNIPPHYAVVISEDARKAANYHQVIEEWNRIAALSDIPLPTLKHSTAEAFFAQVNTPASRLEVVSGERPDLWLYIHGPAHYQAIKAKREAGVLLPAAEMFTTFHWLMNNKQTVYPRERFDKAWMASIYPDHGWGGKNGDITDSIFRASLELARDMGKELLDEALTGISDQVTTRKKNALVVYNDLHWMRSDIVTFEVDGKLGKSIVVKDETGQTIPAQFTHQGETITLKFLAENVPSIGYKTYYIHTGKAVNTPPLSIAQNNNFYENNFYRVTLGKGGIESLYDKQLDKELLNTTKFEGGDIMHVGYYGNGAGEFAQIPLPQPGDMTLLSDQQGLWKMVENGPLYTTYEHTQPMKHTDVTQRICIYHDLKKIDFDVTLGHFDGTHNRQFRMALPLNMDNATIHYEVPMGVLQAGRDEMKTVPGGWAWGGTYRQRPEEIHPREIQNFISASGNGFGLTLSSPVAVADWIDPSREAVNYPVLQGILLSSHKSCHGLGNWYEQKGTHQYTFSLQSHAEGWGNGYQFGMEANRPLHAVLKEEASNGKLPATLSFLSASDPFVQVTTVKKSDADDGVIVRMTEMKGKDSDVRINLPLPVRQVIQTNLIEEEQKLRNTSGEVFMLPVGHHAIETYKLLF